MSGHGGLYRSAVLIWGTDSGEAVDVERQSGWHRKHLDREPGHLCHAIF